MNNLTISEISGEKLQGAAPSSGELAATPSDMPFSVSKMFAKVFESFDKSTANSKEWLADRRQTGGE